MEPIDSNLGFPIQPNQFDQVAHPSSSNEPNFDWNPNQFDPWTSHEPQFYDHTLDSNSSPNECDHTSLMESACQNLEDTLASFNQVIQSNDLRIQRLITQVEELNYIITLSI